MNISDKLSAFWAMIIGWDEKELFSHLTWLFLLIMFLFAAGAGKWRKKPTDTENWHDNRPKK